MYRLTALFKMKISVYFQALDITYKKQSTGCLGPKAVYSYDTRLVSGFKHFVKPRMRNKLGKKSLTFLRNSPATAIAHF